MKRDPRRKGRMTALRLVAAQAIVVALISTLCFVLWGEQLALSALMGGSVAVVPNLVFATLTFSRLWEKVTGSMVNAFYRGEAIKLMLTVTLFVLAFAVVKSDPRAVFGCYISALMVLWMAPLLFQRKHLG